MFNALFAFLMASDTSWMSVLQEEDWKGVLDLVTNARQFVSSVRDVAWRLSDYTKFSKMSETSDITISSNPVSSQKRPDSEATTVVNKLEETMPDELLTPGAFYYLKRDIEENSGSVKSREFYTLWKRNPGENFQRILLDGNLISVIAITMLSGMCSKACQPQLIVLKNSYTILFYLRYKLNERMRFESNP